MNPDVALVAGILVGGLAIISAVSAFSDGHRPRLAVLVMAVAVALVVYATWTRDGGYSLNSVFEAILRVVAMII